MSKEIPCRNCIALLVPVVLIVTGATSLAPPATVQSRVEVEGLSGDSTSLKSVYTLRSPQEFHRALNNSIGFSFLYGNKRVGPGTPIDWEISRQTGPDGSENI